LYSPESKITKLPQRLRKNSQQKLKKTLSQEKREDTFRRATEEDPPN